jgi:hypothetical protein
MIRRRVFVALAALGLAGCAPAAKYTVKSGYRPPALTAVLMLDNDSNDLDAADVVRYWFDRRLGEKKGYRTLPLETVDAVLERHGIRDGGQLPSVSPQTLGAELKVPALIYGEVLEFDHQTTGFVNVRKVRARFWMVDAATGEKLWETEGLGSSSSAAVSGKGALEAGLRALGTQVAEKNLSTPLRTEIWDMIWDAIQYLPRGS